MTSAPRWRHDPLLRAYLCAPVGAALVFGVLSLVAGGGREASVREAGAFSIFALCIAYFCGALLLPLFDMYEQRGWGSWKAYVLTASASGAVVGMAMAMPWPIVLLFAAAAASCGVIFSVVLTWSNKHVHPPAAGDHG